MNTRIFAGFVSGLAGLLLAGMPAAFVQAAYPVKPIRILIPFPAGGGADIIGRTIGDQLSARLGQPVVIDNRPGAAGRLATATLSRAEPDGYTLMVGMVGPISISPALFKKLPYNVERDIMPLTRVAEVINVMVVNQATGVNSVREFIDWSGKRPGNVRFGSSGPGQFDHLAAEFFQRRTGIRMTHVPYKGGGPALIDLVSGDLHVMFSTYVTAIPHIKSGRLRALAVTSSQRQELLPGLPTVGETVPGFGLSNWNGMFAPAKTPRAIADRLAAEINRALEVSDVKKKQNALGIEPVGSPSRRDFSKFVHDDTLRWAKIIKDANLKVE